jgi:hypothetical protein
MSLFGDDEDGSSSQRIGNGNGKQRSNQSNGGLFGDDADPWSESCHETYGQFANTQCSRRSARQRSVHC